MLNSAGQPRECALAGPAYRQGDRVRVVVDGDVRFGTVQHDLTLEDDEVVYLRLDGDDRLLDPLHAYLAHELTLVIRNTFSTYT